MKVNFFLRSLDDFIASRQGLSASGESIPDNTTSLDESDDNKTRAQRIAAFRSRNRSESAKRAASLKAIHLLSTDEVLSLFGDVASGLAFLVIIHEFLWCVSTCC